MDDHALFDDVIVFDYDQSPPAAWRFSEARDSLGKSKEITMPKGLVDIGSSQFAYVLHHKPLGII